MIFKSANVFLIEKNGFEETDVYIKNGKIERIGDCSSINCSEVIDAKGKYLMPGYIDAHSHIGLYEEGLGWEGNDLNEWVKSATPAIRAIDGIKPSDTAFADCLDGGVTTVSVEPGSSNVIGGLCSVISTYGNVVDDMVIRSNYAMKCALGENTKGPSKGDKGPFTRMAAAQILRSMLLKTRAYIAKKKHSESNDNFFDIDFDLEALVPVIEKKMLLKVHAHRDTDILTAIRISKECDVNIIIIHGTESHLIVDKIKENNIPIINGPTFCGKSKPEVKNKTFDTAKILVEHGVKVAITTDHPFIPLYGLNICAMLACKAGLSPFEALKTITINAAEILGIDTFKGQIKLGYDADLVLWSKHPLDIMCKALTVLIKGYKVR